ncbi:L-amino acid N-acyltransferase YncA [Psychrobacter sp. PL15]|jgi:L-amino acid N-acyltransferase YncA|uniref:GNAT family N-acetyltransferase n=1 Tax=unclassified Psychrobacter TaxID=196806 RepID=UPI001AE6308F|nr:GNAT family N-acetyltransferase [Psychrobacter sp. PL15]MEC5209409.1 L-amino acid N-acyltransferase YncA [Psychrobacter sp. PL15]
MSDINAAPTMLSVDRLTDQFIVQRAGIEDLSVILAIYNQTIAGKQATANLVPVTSDERAAWFEDHLNNPTRPIYVVKTVNAINHTDPTDQIDAMEPTSIIIAWGSFSDLYARTAYNISSEISVYLHYDYHGRGLGKLLTRWMLTQAPSLGIQNVVALVFAHNQPSLGLFNKLGFEQWGYMPQVCDMQGFIADVVMLGKALAVDNSNQI